MATRHSIKSLAQTLFEQAFNPFSEPRSAEYQSGCIAGLRYRTGESPLTTCPYPPSSEARDAWYAGMARARNRWRLHQLGYGPKE
jgi:hypothetical protein